MLNDSKDKEMYAEFRLENWNGRGLLEDVDVNGEQYNLF
jgi:hypothetical protein